MKLLQEFKQFALRGNVVDLAVGLIIGSAFSKIVSSLVDNVVMPPIGLLIGGVDFSDLKVVLKEGAQGAAPVLIEYGKFLQTIIDFTIMAFAVFLLIKLMNRMHINNVLAPKVAPTRDQILLEEIRDAIKSKNSE